MKQLRLKAETWRFFGSAGKAEPSETGKMSDSRHQQRGIYSSDSEFFSGSTSSLPDLSAPFYDHSSSASKSSSTNFIRSSTTPTLSDQLRATLQIEHQQQQQESSSTSLNPGGPDSDPNHQRSESTCNLLDYEEHIMRRDFTRSRQELEQLCKEEDQLPVIAFMLTSLRRSLLTCATIDEGAVSNGMDISWPTNVRHVTHVTFDRFNGFLGLPVEFEVEVPGRAPSASAKVFGVSPESMQCSYDSRGNSVPTILLRMQDRLYSLGGLKAEGIFRINAENSHEEHVRDQLNKGIVPFHIDLHCLAGLIKAWFRELPAGVLDTLSPDQVMQCHTEEQSVALVKLLPPMQAALLDWAINLMADVAQNEGSNKMNARNVAMVFAPNMTQMADPLTALMHAVQVMNLLKTLILRTIRDRQELMLDSGPAVTSQPPRNDSADNTPLLEASKDEIDYDEIGPCSRSHSKQANVVKSSRGSNRLVNRIDQHVERVEAW